MSGRTHAVRVGGLPPWLDARRFLGPGDWSFQADADGWLEAHTQLPTAEAADLQARLRGMGIGGAVTNVQVLPALPRVSVRSARREEARRLRDTTPGFREARARAEGAGRYSLTPEALALQMGRRAGRCSVVDACAGAGGNTLGFARAGCRVTAVEPDANRLAELRHNVRVYGMQDRVRVRAGTLQEWLPRLTADLLFADPPWGERYDRRHCGREAIPLLEPVLAQRSRFGALWLKLPPSFDVASLRPGRVTPYFGTASGDFRRVKFLLVEL